MMAGINKVLEHLGFLIDQHDGHMQQTYKQLMDGVEPEELAIHFAYGAGLHHAIRVIQEAVDA